MPLTDEDEIFLNFLEQTYISTGLLPTQGKISECGFSKTQWRRLLNSPIYYEQLIGRGIRKETLDELRAGRRDRQVLSEQQMTAVAIYLDFHDPNSQRKKLAEQQISTNMWNMWLRDPVFQQYIQERASNMLKDNRHEADFALLQKVRSGDIRAIDYYNDKQGFFSRNPGSNTAPALDVKMFLVKVMETIQRHVNNIEVMEAIANDLLQYAQAEGFASRVMVELAPLNIPEPTPVVPYQLSLVAPPLPEVAEAGGL